MTPESKKGGKSCESGEQDRLSDLPDHILQHILSFLPTKNAVATTILSSRWTSVWTSVPVLDLIYDQEDDHDQEKFVNFVERVLRFHNISNVRTFSLSSTFPLEFSRLDSWLTAILKSKTPEVSLWISLPIDDEFMFPNCLFTSDSLSTLTFLKIEMLAGLEIPSASICFIELKFLHLSCVLLSTQSLEQQVILDFPNLETFVLDSFYLVNITSLTIRAPKLKRLTISDTASSPQDSHINIYAESLIFLSFESIMSHNYSLYNMSSVVKADVAFHEVTGIAKLLRAISNVNDITFKDSTRLLYVALSEVDHFLRPITFPSVTNLTVKEVHSLDFRGLMFLLHVFPNLESLCITSDIHDCFEEEWALPPECFLNHLKSITLTIANVDDLPLVEFFLENASVLERMKILCSKDVLNSVEKQVLLVPRASPQCIINFS